MSTEDTAKDQGIEVRTYFVRGRNAMVARAEFSELFAAMYLHQMDWGIRFEPAQDQLLRDGLAAMTLHCASRPRNEVTGWTIHFQDPKANVFINGDSRLGTVVGNVLTENVKDAPSNLFYADSVAEGKPNRRSVVDFEGSDMLRAVERFYTKSEQRPIRLFWHDEEDLVMISAQPDCDLEWLSALDVDAVRRLDKEETLSLLEQRYYRFECGCNQDRMLSMLAPVMRAQPEELFQGEQTIRVGCPRCGARHAVTREALEAHMNAAKKD